MSLDPEKMRFCRRAKGLSQEAVGQALGGLTKVTISSWELGKKPVHPRHYAALSRLFEVPIERLMPDSDSSLGYSSSPAEAAPSRRSIKENLETLDQPQLTELFGALLESLSEKQLDELFKEMIQIKQKNETD